MTNRASALNFFSLFAEDLLERLQSSKNKYIDCALYKKNSTESRKGEKKTNELNTELELITYEAPWADWVILLNTEQFLQSTSEFKELSYRDHWVGDGLVKEEIEFEKNWTKK